jgi:hypothetical protein
MLRHIGGGDLGDHRTATRVRDDQVHVGILFHTVAQQDGVESPDGRLHGPQAAVRREGPWGW